MFFHAQKPPYMYIPSYNLSSVYIFLFYIFFWVYIYPCISFCIYDLSYILPHCMHISSVYIVFICMLSPIIYFSICSFYPMFLCFLLYMLFLCVCPLQVHIPLYISSILCSFIWLLLHFYIASMYMFLFIYLPSSTCFFSGYVFPYVYPFHVYVLLHVYIFVLLFFYIEST